MLAYMKSEYFKQYIFFKLKKIGCKHISIKRIKKGYNIYNLNFHVRNLEFRQGFENYYDEEHFTVYFENYTSRPLLNFSGFSLLSRFDPIKSSHIAYNYDALAVFFERYTVLARDHSTNGKQILNHETTHLNIIGDPFLTVNLNTCFKYRLKVDSKEAHSLREILPHLVILDVYEHDYEIGFFCVDSNQFIFKKRFEIANDIFYTLFCILIEVLRNYNDLISALVDERFIDVISGLISDTDSDLRRSYELVEMLRQ